MNFLECIGSSLIGMAKEAGGLMLLFLDALRRLKDVSIREVFRQMVLLGVDSLPIVMMTILCTGMVFSVQIAQKFVELGAGSTVGGIVTVAMGRELVPILTGIVVAGRIGSNIAAELGTMKVTEQIDALKVMAANPVSYLVGPRLIAIVLMMPVLVIFGNLIGDMGGWAVANLYAGITSASFINSTRTYAEMYDIVGGMMKSCVFGALVATVGCYKGLNAGNGAEGVGQATIRSVVLSIILIFIFNYFLSILIYV